MNHQRFFFGLKPDAEVAESIQTAWQQRGASGRAHHRDDLHLTLVFLGELAASEAEIAALADNVHTQPFTLDLLRVGYWSKPKVLVLEPAQTPQPLQLLVKQLRQAAQRAGIALDDRPYRPHVTLARKASMRQSFALPCPIRWPVAEFALFVSDWSGPPPHYRLLRRWPIDRGFPGQGAAVQ